VIRIVSQLTAIASIFLSSTYVQAQTDTTSPVAENLALEATTTAPSSLWEIVGQAGNIQYPIYGLLVVGIFLISLKLFELLRDRSLEKQLQNKTFVNLPLQEIQLLVGKQKDFLLSRIMAKLLNVFLTNKNADYLHDEIANYNSIQKDNYASFKNRIDFLSDTAGALGLLGTVWGMFIVFSSGSIDKEVILIGMGIALMSTLLGLVVSIILNFFTTIIDGYFSKQLERVVSKADELRFRLIELSENGNRKNPF
jgi:biopolymer transport protein ExbB/TolQ